MVYSGMSDIGRKRESNQDAYRVLQLCQNGVLAVVCDGMGGANGGNIASATAIDVFCSAFADWFGSVGGTADSAFDFAALTANDEDGGNAAGGEAAGENSVYARALRRAVLAANAAVYRKAQSDDKLNGMGTTLVAALFADDALYVANVGDSRFYIIDETELHQITHDHSYVQYLIDIGELSPEEAERSPYRNIITRALGMGETLDVDVFTVAPSQSNRCFLLCSDGLYNYLSAEKIHAALRPMINSTVESDILGMQVASLIRRANENGGGDNITAVVVKNVISA